MIFVTRVRGGVLRYLSRWLEGGVQKFVMTKSGIFTPLHIIVEDSLGVANNDVSLREF